MGPEGVGQIVGGGQLGKSGGLKGWGGGRGAKGGGPKEWGCGRLGPEGWGRRRVGAMGSGNPNTQMHAEHTFGILWTTFFFLGCSKSFFFDTRKMKGKSVSH